MAVQVNDGTEMVNVEIPCGEDFLPGILTVPHGATAAVVFAHGSGSSRFSPRNQYVAEVLQQGNLATLLFDLLTEDEGEDRTKVFAIDMLASRLHSGAAWLNSEERTRDFRLGYFGASTGAAAALVAASRQPDAIGAVVSRGGRPDLANEVLPAVASPTLLIVGGDDDVVLRLNEKALALLTCRKELKVISGATHLFEEPGTLEEVARLATEWFVRWLIPPGSLSRG